MEKTSRYLNGVAEQVQRHKAVRGGPIVVDVRPACAPAKRYLEIREWILDHSRELHWTGYSGVSVDSSQHVALAPGSAAQRKRLEHRYGSLVAVYYEAPGKPA